MTVHLRSSLSVFCLVPHLQSTNPRDYRLHYQSSMVLLHYFSNVFHAFNSPSILSYLYCSIFVNLIVKRIHDELLEVDRNNLSTVNEMIIKLELPVSLPLRRLYIEVHLRPDECYEYKRTLAEWMSLCLIPNVILTGNNNSANAKSRHWARLITDQAKSVTSLTYFFVFAWYIWPRHIVIIAPWLLKCHRNSNHVAWL